MMAGKPQPRAALTAEQRPPPGAVAIPLTAGWVAWVDESDYPRLCAFTWRYGGRGRRHNRPGYAVRLEKRDGLGRRVRTTMHAAIMGEGPHLVDHRTHMERIRVVDNRRINLRVCTTQQNAYNRRPNRGKTATGYKGVYPHPRSGWVARISYGRGRHLSLGGYSTPERAAIAYDEAAIRYHGDFAWLNFPREMQA